MIIVATSNPKTLLKLVYDGIDDSTIETWEYDADGDFTHVPEQWNCEAWLRPYIEPGVLRFGLIGRDGITMKRMVFSIYHGRFIEMLINHCYEYFSLVQATSFGAENVDQFKTKRSGARSRRS